AEHFGAELVLLRGVVGSDMTHDGKPKLFISGGYEVTAHVAIASPGMDWRRLNVDGVHDLLDRGVYYGAGRSEAARCRGDSVVVVGAGNSAGQAVMNLANAKAHVTMVVRGDSLGKTMSGYLVDRIEAHPGIDVRLHTQVTDVEPEDDHLGEVTLTDGGGRSERHQARALFLCIGGEPRTTWAEAAGVRTNEQGFILTGPDLLEDGHRPDSWPLDRDPLALETSVPGLFAAGDVRSGSTKRVGAAVGEGAMATALVHRRLEELVGGG
ncbi:MAG TPA: NAD(P)/FAD-dependent oxidoreductase, partial [Thermoleophilaceae bacterium]